MNIAIIGWYGTETLGDRAILAGILSFLSNSFGDCKIQLGSLYPFFTERTLCEDYDLWGKICNKKIEVEIFDSQKKSSLDRAIQKSDLIVMGGGPLMHINPLFMVEYAFKEAQKKKKKTAILGCGVGPLFSLKHQKSVVSILNHSDLIILRDKLSLKNLKSIYSKQRFTINENNIFVSHDPAIKSAILAKPFLKRNDDQCVCINMRKFPKEYSRVDNHLDINGILMSFLNEIATEFHDKKIYLIPMHYFHVGGDDRFFLNEASLLIGKDNVFVQNKPLSLVETMEVYQNAVINVGMRFHSVILQTILNGNNYILDYTEPNKGKILGFVNDIDTSGFLKKRYLNLQEDKPNINFLRDINDQFHVDFEELSQSLNVYEQKLVELKP